MHLAYTPRPKYHTPAAVHEDRNSLGGCHSFEVSFCYQRGLHRPYSYRKIYLFNGCHLRLPHLKGHTS